MAHGDGNLTAAQKGKGKADEGKSANGEKPEEVKKDKDGKPIVNSKKGDADAQQEGTAGVLTNYCSCS
jgi:hypothetical protein